MKCCLKLELIQNLPMIVQYVKFNAILKRYLMYIYKDQNTKENQCNDIICFGNFNLFSRHHLLLMICYLKRGN